MKYWKDIAQRGRGAYVAIPQAGGVRVLSTPFDKRLAEINAELVKHTLLFGPAAKRDADQKKLTVAGGLPAEVAADRAGYLAKEGKTAPYDLLDALRAGKVRLEALRTEEFPPELQKMTAQQRQEHINKLARARAKLLKEAHDLDRQRGEHLARELLRNKNSFDSQVLEMLRRQASRRMRF